MHGSKEDPTKLCILGVYFDRQLTFRHHLQHVQQCAQQHICQLSDKIQRIQSKALQLALGVPHCTWIDDLHVEANIVPLIVHFQMLTAVQAEKYQHYPLDNEHPFDHFRQSAHLGSTLR